MTTENIHLKQNIYKNHLNWMIHTNMKEAVEAIHHKEKILEKWKRELECLKELNILIEELQRGECHLVVILLRLADTLRLAEKPHHLANMFYRLVGMLHQLADTLYRQVGMIRRQVAMYNILVDIHLLVDMVYNLAEIFHPVDMDHKLVVLCHQAVVDFPLDGFLHHLVDIFHLVVDTVHRLIDTSHNLVGIFLHLADMFCHLAGMYHHLDRCQLKGRCHHLEIYLLLEETLHI